MITDFDSVFSDCSEFKELLIIEPEKDDSNVVQTKVSVSKGKIKKSDAVKSVENKVDISVTKNEPNNKLQQLNEKNQAPQNQKESHLSYIPKLNLPLDEKQPVAQNEKEKKIEVSTAKELKDNKVTQIIEKKSLHHNHKESLSSLIPKLQNQLNDKKPVAQNHKDKNVSNIAKPANIQPQKQEPLKPSSVKPETNNLVKSPERQSSLKENSINKLLQVRESNIKKRDKTLEKTVTRLNKLEEENIDKLEKPKASNIIEKESKLMENTINMLHEIKEENTDKVTSQNTNNKANENKADNTDKLVKSIENNKNILREFKQSKEKNENILKEFKKSKDSSNHILKEFKKENTDKLQTTFESKLKDFAEKTDVPTEDPEDIIPSVETLQLQERELLRSKIEEMEKLQSKLELHLIAQHSLPEGSNYDLNRIHNKFAKLQRENKNLERRIVYLMQQNFERIDDLKDNIRYLTKQETDVVYTYKELRSKLPGIETVQTSNIRLLNKINDIPVSSGSTTIQDLQSRLRPLTNKKGYLENNILKLRREQIILADRLQHKKRINILEKAENETEIKKQQATCRLLGDIKRDLLKKFEVAKHKMKENSSCEIQKIKKLELTVHELSDRFKKLSDEKKELEKLNTSLKDRVVKKSEELNSREMYVS